MTETNKYQYVAIGSVATLLLAGSLWYAYERSRSSQDTFEIISLDTILELKEDERQKYAKTLLESNRKRIFVQKQPGGTR